MNRTATAASTEQRTSVKFSDTISSVLLDLLRGIAAIIVLVEHWRNLLFVPYSDVVHKSAFVKIFYALTGGGHQSVIIFFVLSGYLVAGTVIRAWNSNRWSWAVYMEHRLARLWTVLIPVLVLVAILDHVGDHIQRAHPLYIGTHYANMLQDAILHLDVKTMFGNILFLQGIFTHTFGSDGALWSLSYEFWYYILFPLLFVGILSRGPWVRRILQIVLACAIARFVGRDILILFPVWLMGAALHYLPVAKPRPVLLYCLLPFYAAMIFARNVIEPTAQSYILGFATTGMIWLLLGLRSAAPSATWVNGSRLLARFSYTLYLLHTPILVLFTGVWLGLHAMEPTPAHILEASPLLPLALVASYGLASITEFRTEAVRHWAGRSLVRLGLATRSA